MNDLKNNRKIVIVCLSLVFIVILIVILSNYNFGEDKNIEEDYGIKDHYDINEINYLYISTEDVIRKYFNDYKNILINNKEEAYNLLNKDYREKRFNNYDNFLSYLDNNVTEYTYSLGIDKYSVSSINGKKVYNVIANNKNQFIFKENSIMNYEVYLDNYTVEIK